MKKKIPKSGKEYTMEKEIKLDQAYNLSKMQRNPYETPRKIVKGDDSVDIAATTIENKKEISAGSLTTKPKFISKGTKPSPRTVRVIPLVLHKECEPHHKKGIINRKKQDRDITLGTLERQGNSIGRITRATSPAGLFTKKRTYNPIGNVTKTATPSKLYSRNCRSVEA